MTSSPRATGVRPNRVMRWAPLIGLLLVAGCGRSGPDLRDKVLRCAQLEGAARSKLPELTAQIALIRSAGEAPADLTTAPGDDEGNAAAALAQAFTDSIRNRVLPRLDELLTMEQGAPSSAQIDGMRELLSELEPRLLPAAEQAAALPRCVSGVRFEQGFFARYEFLDDAALAARLHLIAAHVALDDGDRDELVKQLRLAGRWTQWLGKERRLEARLLAARLRSEWHQGASLALASPAARSDYVALHETLRDQLRDWPSDRDALVGDRALTLHAYEAIRLGLLDRMVTADEKRQLEQAGLLERLTAMNQQAIDADELYYLQVMNEVIGQSDKPYYQRVDTLVEVLAQATPESAAGERAPLATRLFLVGVGDSVELMARDRALAEAWSLTLASAAGFELPPYRINPINGRPYEASRDAGGVTLMLNDLHTPNPRVALPLEPIAQGSP